MAEPNNILEEPRGSTEPRLKNTGLTRQRIHQLFVFSFEQVMALLPVYLLQICYGMNTGYPAIMTPQLREDCSEFEITEDQESWIGKMLFSHNKEFKMKRTRRKTKTQITNQGTK